ncbi:hypothetical protein BGW38_001262 [Lunasporangiospora selenospora]|uniref:CotH protein n=1 Tax=Lunasporangiospora selenospora TaxID=979761 RepID=A0A9P6G233_9FUNG|nr:hypothetical protein BGW38_001262 [Lunasporangiospora selenospora]
MKFLAGLATLAAAVSVASADITFSVVGYPTTPGNTYGVLIGGTVHKFPINEETFPVWRSTVAGTDANVQYQYVELDSAGTPVRTEAFTRKHYNATKVATLNEFFERQVTEWEFPKIPYTYLATFPSKTKAFKQKQIATIHITAPPLQMDELNKNPKNDKDYRVDFRFINSETVHSVKNITFSTSGKSSKGFAKQSYKLKFDTKFNQTFFSRPNIKLRSMVQDPTMIREKLYIDMLNSVGIPTQQGAWVRLFVNNEPYGLYLMVDDIKKSFLKQTVHGGDNSVPEGSLVQMNSWKNRADLVYKGPATLNYGPDSAYESQVLGSNPTSDPLRELIRFMEDLKNFDPVATADPINFWNATRLHLDGVVRGMALEYLMGAFDNYWYQGSNYFMYKNSLLGPSGGKWQYIPTDFDGTFGSGFPTSTIPSYLNYTDFAVQGERPMVQKLILNCKPINELFETALKDIVSTAFKRVAMGPRAEAYNKMLSLDAQWDYSLTRKSPGENNNYTFADFNDNLVKQTRNMQSSVLGWVDGMSDLISKQLNFAIPAEVQDRVAPPPKTGNRGNPDDEEDNEGEDLELPNKGKSAGSIMRPQVVLVALGTLALSAWML